MYSRLKMQMPDDDDDDVGDRGLNREKRESTHTLKQDMFSLPLIEDPTMHARIPFQDHFLGRFRITG